MGAAGIGLHSLLDGVAIGEAFHAGSSVGWVVALAVVVHKFADGVSTVGILMSTGQSPRAANRILGLIALAPLLSVPVFGWADSGVGVDTWRANKLDPTGGQATEALDPDGTSWLVPGQHRSPTGNLYGTPTEELNPETLSVWQIYGTFDVGMLHTSGEKTALYDRYTRWPTNGPVFDFDVNAERPSDGSYAEVRGSRISAEDQYYEAVYGKAGAYKAEIFMRDMPNLLSTDAKSIFNGAGTSNLTLAGGLVPGGSTQAQVAAVSAAAPVTSLGTERNKQGIALSGYLTTQWTVYLNASDEERKGTRPYGGPFFFDFDNIGGSVLETIKPIDDDTVNITAGARYAGSDTFRQPDALFLSAPAAAVPPCLFTSLEFTTPSDVFAALRMAISFDAVAIRRLAKSSRPVVPIRIGIPAAIARSRLAWSADGAEKSTSTSP